VLISTPILCFHIHSGFVPSLSSSNRFSRRRQGRKVASPPNPSSSGEGIRVRIANLVVEHLDAPQDN